MPVVKEQAPKFVQRTSERARGKAWIGVQAKKRALTPRQFWALIAKLS